MRRKIIELGRTASVGLTEQRQKYFHDQLSYQAAWQFILGEKKQFVDYMIGFWNEKTGIFVLDYSNATHEDLASSLDIYAEEVLHPDWWGLSFFLGLTGEVEVLADCSIGKRLPADKNDLLSKDLSPAFEGIFAKLSLIRSDKDKRYETVQLF